MLSWSGSAASQVGCSEWGLCATGVPCQADMSPTSPKQAVQPTPTDTASYPSRARNPMADAAPELDVIAVGAHPDDVEIGCGGTLAKLAEQGYRVGIVDLTDGEPTPGSPGPEVRLAEATAAAQILGV